MINKRRKKKRVSNSRGKICGLLSILICTNFLFRLVSNGNNKIQEEQEVQEIISLVSLEKEELEVSDNRSKKIEDLINSKYLDYKDNISIFYYNLETGDEYSLNEDKYFYGASTLKLPQAMMVLDKVYKGEISLDDILIYEEDDYEEGTGSLQYNDITRLTVEEAIYLSITESDNIAKNMLSKILDDRICEYIKNISWNFNIESNYITARDLYLVLKKLYLNEEENPYYDNLIEMMKETIFHTRLDRYIDETLVAHKIGSYNRYYHDIGIIYGSEPYILVVLTKDIGEVAEGNFEDEKDRYVLDWGEEAEEVIGDISKDIYDIVEEG